MALSHDLDTRFPAGVETDVDTTTGDRTFSHGGSASAKGVVVMIDVGASGADGVTGVTYGGVALTKVVTADDTVEQHRITLWCLPTDTACPTGTQDCVLQGANATAKYAVCSTILAGTTGIKVNANNKVDTTTSANPTMNVVTTATAMLYGAVGSGAASPTNITLGSGYTMTDKVDFGSRAGKGQRSTSPVSSGTIVFDFTIASDDWCLAAVAIEEYDLPAGDNMPKVPTMAPRIPA